MQNLCKISQSKRYDVLTALRHPFITRNFTSEIPRDPVDFVINVHFENRIRKGI